MRRREPAPSGPNRDRKSHPGGPPDRAVTSRRKRVQEENFTASRDIPGRRASPPGNVLAADRVQPQLSRCLGWVGSSLAAAPNDASGVFPIPGSMELTVTDWPFAKPLPPGKFADDDWLVGS